MKQGWHVVVTGEGLDSSAASITSTHSLASYFWSTYSTEYCSDWLLCGRTSDIGVGEERV